MSLHEIDNDPVAFWLTIVAALEGVFPGLGGDRLKSVLARERPDIDGVVLPLLLNALAAQEESSVLVLDRFSRVREPACLGQIEALVDRLPPTLQLVLITRTVPALPLTRYRADGDVLELRMADLRLTKQETAEFVQQVAGLRLHDADLDDLLDRTEGWAAALSLAAGALRSAADPAAFIADFTGTHRLVLDYLTEEVLRELPDDTRRFLARSSVLGTFTAELCAEVADVPNGAALLDELDRANLFLVPLDAHRRWYRYHRLFVEALRAELSRTEPELVPALHLRASGWLARHDLIDDAVTHALAADHVDLAADLFTTHWGRYVEAGRLMTVRGWMHRIGLRRIGGDPRTALCAAWVAALCGERPAARTWLEIADSSPCAGPLPDGSPSLGFATSMVRAFFGFDGVTEMARAAETAAAIERDQSAPWYAVARFVLGYSRYLRDDLAGAVDPLEEAARSTAVTPACRGIASSVLSLILGRLGDHARSARLARTAHELVETRGLPESPDAVLADTAWGAVLAHEGHHEEARRVLERALAVRTSVADLSPWPTLNLLVVLAETALDAGDEPRARVRHAQARDLIAAEPDCGEHLRRRTALLDARLPGARPPDAPAPLHGPGEPLTEREQAVLRLLMGAAPLREIAQSLYVSANTVKTHTRSIYRKLGATSREHAVRRAHELGLL
ncbi:hypothetical protein HII36_34170 [Nonomuraea sp. NN258]|uniref:LuxR C-terminal-related transcriptional regulator n=1 Tax=Nonomuraea antri TaxID=2730852 RepID=UPI001569B852|nr:LuxR C-terminal-related transcriptional regulator [Nonomuraea antri]NRQ36849.1 hypothetical protein [Nonomuraea antri]